MPAPHGFADKVTFIWKVADKLRGSFKQHEYGSIILPLLVLRRMDAVLADSKNELVAKAATFGDHIGPGQDQLLKRIAGQSFYNVSPLTMTTLLADDKNVAMNLGSYIRGLSPSAQEMIDAYDLESKIQRMDRAGILYAVLGDFADLDVRPSQVGNEAMGYIFEELLRKFSEMSNETAGEHYTPREVIHLMVDLLLAGEEELTSSPKPVRTAYDPAAGTGGMLTMMLDRIHDLNSAALVEVFGQELNPETWAIARSDLMIQGVSPERMVLGNSLTEDAYRSETFDYILANPPYGVDWKAYADPIRDEHERLGFAGRFGAGLPRVSDGSLLFLQHMISKMKPGGSRVAIVLSGSPLFSGAAGSGESEIRRWILQADLLEGIVALPDQMFYNTGISTYVWILANGRKPEASRGRVILVDARDMGTKMRKSLGDKRKELTDAAIREIVGLYGNAFDAEFDDSRVKVMRNEGFGFQRVTVERPMRRRWEVTDETLATLGASKKWVSAKLDRTPEDVFGSLRGSTYPTSKDFIAALDALAEDLPGAVVKELSKLAAVHDPDADPITKRSGEYEPDADLRDAENIPLPDGFHDLDEDEQAKVLVESAEDYLEAEIRPYVPDAWIDHSKTKLGYEIPFTRQFYVYEPPRPVEEIAAEIRDVETQIQEWMKGLGL